MCVLAYSDGVMVKMFECKKVMSSVTYSVPGFIACLFPVDTFDQLNMHHVRT